MYKCSGKQYIYMHKVIYNNKLKYNSTLLSFNPRPLYVGPIQTKGHLSFKDTCQDLYSYLSVTCVIYLAEYGAARHLSILCSVRKLLTHTMQCWEASNLYILSFYVAYIVFILFHNHIYQNYIVSRYIFSIRLIFYILKT